MEDQIRMNDLFKKDITIKIMSVLIAVLFWLYVSNTSNPFTTKTFYNIPVKIENAGFLNENGYIVKNTYRNSIDVTIRGRREAIDRVRSSDFEAALDFSQIKSVNDKTLKITGPTCTQRDVTIVGTNPPTIDIQLARNKGGSFPVELKSNITMKPGYELLNTTMSPDSLQIVAEESIINSVGSIRANLDLKNLDRDTTKTVDCKVYNTDGKEITSLSTDLKVTVNIQVAKKLPVSLVTRGRLAADYVETMRMIEPVEILVTGPAAALEKLTDIKTEQIDIDRISANYSASVPLVLPNGVKLVDNSEREIKVGINVEKLVTRAIEMSQEDISILNGLNDGTLTYEIKTDKLTLQVKGMQRDVEDLQASVLKPAVDVSGLGEGTHKLPLNISLPSQVKLLTQAYVDVIVTKTTETTAPTVP
jgi:YbbR domain-containing protein